jgi:hypothetical protein
MSGKPGWNRGLKVAFDPERHCGATRKRDGGPCRHPRGFRTDHPGAGNCYVHGGRSPNGIKHAQHEQAEQAVAKLGIPRGTGDPFVLLAKAVQHAEGYLEAAATTAAEAADATVEKPSTIPLDVAADIYADAIRTASRTGKAAVDADVADRLAAIDERAGNLLMRFVNELLERAVPKTKRPEITAWASGRLAELAAEYEHGVVH